jgi:alditol oxidase
MNREANWAGNYVYAAETIHRPQSIAQVQELVGNAWRIRVLGSRHTFNDIADSDELMVLDDMPAGIAIDRDAMTVTVGGSTRYGTLAQALEEQGLALHNMASLPHITVAGAVGTATHGSGDRHGNLATAVSGIELVSGMGEIVSARRGDPDFDGMVVHLGTLGVVTRITLDVEPSYRVAQEVIERVPWDSVTGSFDEVFGSAWSVSVFTLWGDEAGLLWIKHRLDGDAAPTETPTFGGSRATIDRHPLDGFSGDACTAQLMAPGAWCDRLPHFRMDRVPASGEEIQVEYMVDRSRALDVIDRLRAFEPELRDLLYVTEIRTVAADQLWMSTAYGRDTVCFHFSFKPDQAGVDALMPKIEAQIADCNPRPHWGKAFAMGHDTLVERYPRMEEFERLANRLDSQGVFRNTYLERTVFGKT